MASGHFPHYAATPESIEASAERLETSALRLEETGSGVNQVHRPAQAAVEGDLTDVFATAPNQVGRHVRQTVGASLVAAGALRSFGQAVREHDQTMDTLESEWQSALAEDWDVVDPGLAIAAREATLRGLLARRETAGGTLDERANDAARLLAQPTDEALHALFAAGHLPTRVPTIFPDIEFTYDALPSDFDELSHAEQATYALRHPEQAELLYPELSAGALGIMADRIEGSAGPNDSGESLRARELAAAYGFANVASMLFVFRESSYGDLTGYRITQEIENSPELIEDPTIRGWIESSISELTEQDGRNQAYAVELYLQDEVDRLDVEDLTLVSLHIAGAERSGEPVSPQVEPYMKGFYDYVAKNQEAFSDADSGLGDDGPRLGGDAGSADSDAELDDLVGPAGHILAGVDIASEFPEVPDRFGKYAGRAGTALAVGNIVGACSGDGEQCSSVVGQTIVDTVGSIALGPVVYNGLKYGSMLIASIAPDGAPVEPMPRVEPSWPAGMGGGPGGKLPYEQARDPSPIPEQQMPNGANPTGALNYGGG